MAKTTYGLNAAVVYKANDRNHKLRAHTIRTYPSGLKKIPNQFSSLLTKAGSILALDKGLLIIIGNKLAGTSCFRGGRVSPAIYS